MTLSESLFYDLQTAPTPAKLRALQHLIPAIGDSTVPAEELQAEANRRWLSQEFLSPN